MKEAKGKEQGQDEVQRTKERMKGSVQSTRLRKQMTIEKVKGK